MSTLASKITSLTNVYSTVYSGADQRKHQRSGSLAFVWGIHRRPHKWPVTRKMFPFDDVIMTMPNSISIWHRRLVVAMLYYAGPYNTILYSIWQWFGFWTHHDDVIKWKHFPRYWPFVRGIHQSPVNSPHKGQWRRALMFPLICVGINGWINNRKAGDLRRYCAHYDVSVMQ